MTHPTAPGPSLDRRRFRSPVGFVRSPSLHADDSERLDYLLDRMLQAGVPQTGGHRGEAHERLAQVVERMAERGDEWATRVQRYWAWRHDSEGPCVE